MGLGIFFRVSGSWTAKFCVFSWRQVRSVSITTRSKFCYWLWMPLQHRRPHIRNSSMPSIGNWICASAYRLQTVFYGWGERDCKSNLVKGIWNLPVTDINGMIVNILFYITDRDGFSLLGIELPHINWNRKVYFVSQLALGTFMSKYLCLQTYFESTSAADLETGRTHLLVIPFSIQSFKTFLTESTILISSCEETFEKFPHQDRAIAEKLASKLHSHMHFRPAEMIIICKLAGVLSDILKAELETVYNIFTSCKKTGRPQKSRWIFFNRFLADFKDTLQIDLLSVSELTKNAIFYVTDVATAFSAADVMSTMGITGAMKAFEHNWIDAHGPPRYIFANTEPPNKFAAEVNHFGIAFKPAPARRQNNLEFRNVRTQSSNFSSNAFVMIRLMLKGRLSL